VCVAHHTMSGKSNSEHSKGVVNKWHLHRRTQLDENI
jgi:hypothetical protein